MLKYTSFVLAFCVLLAPLACSDDDDTQPAGEAGAGGSGGDSGGPGGGAGSPDTGGEAGGGGSPDTGGQPAGGAGGAGGSGGDFGGAAGEAGSAGAGGTFGGDGGTAGMGGTGGAPLEPWEEDIATLCTTALDVTPVCSEDTGYDACVERWSSSTEALLADTAVASCIDEYLAYLSCIAVLPVEDFSCNFDEVAAPTEPMEPGDPCYTELDAQNTCFADLSS